jgi:hypothetical protein
VLVVQQVLTEVGAILKEEKLQVQCSFGGPHSSKRVRVNSSACARVPWEQAVICVAGGWAGGNAASEGALAARRHVQHLFTTPGTAQHTLFLRTRRFDPEHRPHVQAERVDVDHQRPACGAIPCTVRRLVRFAPMALARSLKLCLPLSLSLSFPLGDAELG